MRGGLVIGAGGALHGARIVCDAMRCDARDAMQCAAMHGMRCAGRCAAGWLHSRGAGGAMLLTEGFLGWLSRFKGMGGWVGGGMGGWPVCEAWMDGVMGLRVGFINIKRYVQ
jgi:hypothetical protein